MSAKTSSIIMIWFVVFWVAFAAVLGIASMMLHGMHGHTHCFFGAIDIPCIMNGALYIVSHVKWMSGFSLATTAASFLLVLLFLCAYILSRKHTPSRCGPPPNDRAQRAINDDFLENYFRIRERFLSWFARANSRMPDAVVRAPALRIHRLPL